MEWDTLRWQTQWVLRLEGPDGTRYDTVDTNSYTYCGLNLNRYYAVSILTQCYRPGGHNWSEWSEPVGIGNAAIGEIENSELKIEIFPNPASKRVDITSNVPMTHIEAVDVMGNVIATFPQTHSNTFTLDVSSWPAGAYLLRIHTPQGIDMEKLLVH